MIVSVIARAASVGSFLCPKHVGKLFVPVAVIVFVVRTPAVSGLANESTPIMRCVRIVFEFVPVSVGIADAENSETYSRRAIEMRVDSLKLLVVVSVRAWIIQRVR